MALAPGTKLGPYEILAPLGAGGMGEVYEGRDTRLDRTIAIKILPAEFSLDPIRKQRFEREARAISALNHPNICHLYDIGSAGEISYLILEYLTGETLASRLKRGKLPLKETIRYAIEITDALQTAHSQGIVHRDLKPTNIFLTTRGESKVLDFGVAMLGSDSAADLTAATQTDVLTRPGATVGTPAYMSPEQARGEMLDARTDLFSFGAVLYEMATGRRLFEGKTPAMVFRMLLDERATGTLEIDEHTPARLAEIIHKGLEQDRDLRYQSAADMRADLQRLKRDQETATELPVAPARPSPQKPRIVMALGIVAGFLALTGGIWLVRYAGRRAPRAQKWEQLTFFSDPVVYPALSPDGRMLAFIRGSDTFFGPGELYVQLLPGGEPVRLTHDSLTKMSPVFTPDGTRIVYGTGPEDSWDTWEVPAFGGEPRLLLKNASSLTLIKGGQQLLFSEIEAGLHMVLVTTDEQRGQRREVYVPRGTRSMVHHSYLSPDGHWVLLVVMDNQGNFTRCRVVPFDGKAPESFVGPPDAICTAGAWSVDGRWIYVSANVGGKFHIWRQRFPDGQAEQVTSGPTEEEGIAIAPDGESFLTSVGVLDSTIWIHDAKGERQLSSEGTSFGSSFSRDGRTLYYLLQRGQSSDVELWSAELASGKRERILASRYVRPDYIGSSYSVSADGKLVATAVKDPNGISHIWVSSTDHRSSPRQVPSSTSDDSPLFLPDGDLLFRSVENGGNFLNRSAADGSGRRRVIEGRILDVFAVSPDGHWVIVSAKSEGSVELAGLTGYPVEGNGSPVLLCRGLCNANWDVDGKNFYVEFRPSGDLKTYMLPVRPEVGLPVLPPDGLSADSVKSDKRVSALPVEIDSAVGTEKYSYTRTTVRRNIYRITLP